MSAPLPDAHHAVAIVGGAVAGSEAAAVLSRAGVLAVVFEQNERPFGKIEDGLPRWHARQREKEMARIESKLLEPHVLFCPSTKIGREVQLKDLLGRWGFSAVLLANGAWRDRPLPITGIDQYLGRGLAYQNPLVHWFNHYEDPGYDGEAIEIPDGTIVVGGGLASIDVVKIVQLELCKRALRDRGIYVSVIELEHKGIPDVLSRHDLTWEDLGLRGATLYYRRRKQDMPLAFPSENASEEERLRTQDVRVRILDKAMAKYCFRFEPCAVPISAVISGGFLRGLVFQRTEVFEGRRRPPVALPGTETFAESRLTIGSIGSVPEPIAGVPMWGDFYRFPDPETGQLEGLPGVFGLGNVVTGQGNIRRSLEHARDTAYRVIEGYLVGELDEDGALAAPEAAARAGAERALAQVQARPPLEPDVVRGIRARVRQAHARVGYEGLKDWLARVRVS